MLERNGIVRWILMGITVATILLGIGGWNARQEEHIRKNSDSIERHKERISKLEECQIRDGRTLAGMEKQIDFIYKWVVEEKNNGGK